MKIIYLDTLFILNAAADLLCLLAAERVCDRRVGWGRLAAGACLGGGYAVLSVLPETAFLQEPVLYPVFALAMTVTAFGKGSIAKPFFTVLAAGVMLGGAVYAVSIMLGTGDLFSAPGALRVFLISFGAAWGLFALLFRKLGRSVGKDGILEAELTYRGKTVRFHALRDTGNSLRDPVSGKAVLVCEPSVLLPLFDERERAILTAYASEPLKLLEECAGIGSNAKFRLVTYRAVGLSGGMLAAFSPDILRCNGKNAGKTLVAIAPGPVSAGGIYSALAGGEGEG